VGEAKYIPVYYADGMLAGEMVRLLLESFSIQAILTQESAGKSFGLTVGSMGEVAVMVPESQVDEAKEIIDSMESGELENNADDQMPDTYDNKDDSGE
jgi:hypothetical protein